MLAPGFLGKTYGVPARSYVYTTIQPLNSGVVAPYSQVVGDPFFGTYLHFLCNLNMVPNFRSNATPAAPDYVSTQIQVEFEAPSTFSLPFDSTLSFVGGNPDADYRSFIYFDAVPCSNEAGNRRVDPSNYAPTWHFLRHFLYGIGLLPPPVSFVVPDNHTVLLGYRSTDTFTINPGANATTVNPGVNLPGTIVSPGDIVQGVGALPYPVAVTGWFG